jgi:Transglycosylase SLT domain
MSVEAVAGTADKVEGAIRRAAAQTGVDFGFLLNAARRESGLNPKAHAHTSSAAGLFQFVEQTWLSTLKRHGASHGLGAYAAQVEQGGDGRWHVANPKMRKAVMDLRLDPTASALMAGELTQDHAAYLQGRTGRTPSAGELYAAHLLGPAGSARLAETAASKPNAPAAHLFPQAAEANEHLFYRHGRAVTVAELSANLTQAAGGPATLTGPRLQLASASQGQDLRAAALAARLDRVRREQSLTAVLGGQGGGLNSLIDAQLLGAFVGRRQS